MKDSRLGRINYPRLLWAFIKKETLHILRDRRTLLILFGLPVVLVFLFGYAVTNDFKDARIAVVDPSPSALSQSLLRHLEASGHFEVVSHEQSLVPLGDRFRRREVDLAIVLPPDFATEFYRPRPLDLQIVADGTEPNKSTTLVAYVSAMLNAFARARLPASPRLGAVRISTRMVYNPRLESAYNFLPGTIALILLLVSAMMTALTLAKEKELGTMEVLLVSPLPPLLIIAGKIAPYGLLSFIDAVIVVVLGVFVFDVPVHGSLLLLLGACLLYVLTALALGTLIGAKARDQQTAMMASLIALMLPTMLLSGFIFPLEGMPKPLQVIGSAMPATYFVIVLKGVMLKGLAARQLLTPLLVLGGMLAVLLMLSLRAFKIRLE